MTAGARTPEELDALLEDAFVACDRTASGRLFVEDAVLADAGGGESRGPDAIAGVLCASDRIYVAHTGRVLRSGATALVVSGSGIHVVRRGEDRAWRSAISLLRLTPITTTEEAP